VPFESNITIMRNPDKVNKLVGDNVELIMLRIGRYSIVSDLG